MGRKSTPAAHVILDGLIHTDSAAAGVTRGSLIHGNSTPLWVELTIGDALDILGTDGTDVIWRTLAEAGIQAQDDVLDDLAALSVVADNEIIVGTGAGTYAHLAGGSENEILAIVAGSPAWAAGMTRIGQTVLSGNSTTVTFSSIPGDYQHLLLIVYARTDRDVAAGVDIVDAQFNNDTGANYGYQLLTAVGTTVTATGVTSQSTANLFPISGSSTADTFGGGLCIFPHYGNTADFRIMISLSGASTGASSTTGFANFRFFFNQWDEAATAINEIDLTPQLGTNFVAGSVFSLWGIE